MKQAVILHICNAEHKDINIKIIKGVLFGTWNYPLFIYKENKWKINLDRKLEPFTQTMKTLRDCCMILLQLVPEFQYNNSACTL